MEGSFFRRVSILKCRKDVVVNRKERRNIPRRLITKPRVKVKLTTPRQKRNEEQKNKLIENGGFSKRTPLKTRNEFR